MWFRCSQAPGVALRAPQLRAGSLEFAAFPYKLRPCAPLFVHVAQLLLTGRGTNAKLSPREFEGSQYETRVESTPAGVLGSLRDAALPPIRFVDIRKKYTEPSQELSKTKSVPAPAG